MGSSASSFRTSTETSCPDITEICRRFLADEEDFKEYHGETCDIGHSDMMNR